eukprot:GFUD01051610.1.p1 GENE.GFUD01051610.1~~GFUD01051610.1.p1  ORF type:complete len:125 (+),score=15.84 GFUD01051610.1:53-427(+)
MHTFRIITIATGRFDNLTVQHVLNIVRQGLEEDDTWEQFRLYFKKRLTEVLGNSFMCGVDAMGKSFFINVFSSDMKNILIEMVTLKDIAAYTVAGHISKDEHIDSLAIPKSLCEDVRNYIGCTR